MVGSRVLELQGVHNFRDCGGYNLKGGGRLKPGVLWRSGQHHGATDADLARINALGLAHIVDLRTDRERTLMPCRRPEQFAGQVHFVADGSDIQAPHVAAAIREAHSPDVMRDNMASTYRTMPSRPKLVEAIRLYLDLVASGDGPVLINCMAGKDRTGWSVAMLHSAVGVHRDDIIADYLLTNTAGDSEARIQAGIRSSSAWTNKLSEEAIRVMMAVEARYLEAALDTAIAEHGSLEAYQRDVLGVDEAKRERLVAVLTEA